MSDCKEISLVAAALAGGIIAASVPMTADEAVVIFNQVKERFGAGPSSRPTSN